MLKCQCLNWQLFAGMGAINNLTKSLCCVCIVSCFPWAFPLSFSAALVKDCHSQMTIQVVKTMCPDITTLVHKQKCISQSLLGPNNMLSLLVYWLNSL